ncbi:hypothetical protein BWI15_23985 [Kribbella sp. ALI-6-A]|uniref:DUF4262 domain-containing protein n=1 Tax=Kribbella sp. ALI-6-A TaxID=1933817 RepID=UPI00097C1B8F|nr:DUF4262 domain-containing protein [Kribbella sp. ALI-6-A]ONI69622.1 hypothetical protein BWI15_23985 [Kribbella sp. ALI-6-A]
MIDVRREPPSGEYADRVLRLIGSHGWTVEHIGSPDGRRPAITSTVGLCLRGHPEFVVFGCDVLEGFMLLEPLALAVENGKRFESCAELTDLSAGSERFGLISYPNSTRHLPTVNELFRREGTAPIPALVLFRSGLPETPTPPGTARRARYTTYSVATYEAMRAAARAEAQ